MTNFPSGKVAARAHLADQPRTPEPWSDIRRYSDAGGVVTKYVFTKSDCAVESTLYQDPAENDNTILCCSTMSGCPMGCRFCGSGDYFVRNLSACEMVSQAQYILESCDEKFKPSSTQKLQIRAMSMGEPLLNRSLWSAFRRLHFLYPSASLQISTSAPDVDWSWVFDMGQEISAVGLQFSVHESTDEARDGLIPFKKKLNLSRIAQQGEAWHRTTGRQPLFNYCAHGANIGDADADRIARLFSPDVWLAAVSVICEKIPFEPPDKPEREALAHTFARKLLQRGYQVQVSTPVGRESVGSGCGQLWDVQEWMRTHPALARPSIGRGLPEPRLRRARQPATGSGHAN